MFVVSEPKSADQLILGTEDENCLLGLAYQDLKQKKGRKSNIFISVIGIES